MSGSTLSKAIGAGILVLVVAGCGGKSYQVAEVDGVLLIRGKAADKIYIQFIPEATGPESPPPSTAETDASGHFTLQLMSKDGASQPGAVVGSHRVVLQDKRLAASVTGVGVPIRLPQQYTLAGSTPLTQEVKEGKQTIELKVP